MTTIPVYGNYHGYYNKRGTALSEPRLKRLPKDLFKGAVVLDVGCNEGWVTCEIAQSYSAAKVVGVDIDDSLVQGAWRRRRTLWSLQEPLWGGDSSPSEFANATTLGKRPAPPLSAGNASKRARREPEPTRAPLRPNYFPLSCEHEFGGLPIPQKELHTELVRRVASNTGGMTALPLPFPHNLTFRTANWLEEDIPEDKEGGYDVVLALSLTKWLHLHAGDAGLTRFFRKAHRLLRKGGHFVLEPQSWESYAKARRMSEKLKESSKHLKLRPGDFGRVLSEIGFERVDGVEPSGHVERAAEPGVGGGTAGGGGFDRPIDVYVKL